VINYAAHHEKENGTVEVGLREFLMATLMQVTGQLTALAAVTPGERNLSTRWVRCQVSTRAGLEAEEKRKISRP
jgi:hypothetical protein